MHKIIQYRFQLVLVLVLFSISLCGFFINGTSQLRLKESQFYRGKLLQKNKYDVLILGDSRSLMAMSPARMNNFLPSLRIYNFSFPAVPMASYYTDQAIQYLDMQNSARTFLLGITPLGLTKSKFTKNEFVQAKSANSHSSGLLETKATDVFLESFVDRIFNADEIELSDLYADGWAHIQRRGVEYNCEKLYTKRFSKTSLSRDIVDDLLDHVAQWKQQGIRVIGFRVPTAPGIAAIENKLSGFNEDEFQKSFENRGGHWLRFDASKYQTYDGDHLDVNSSLQFSEDLSQELLKKDLF